MIPKQKVKMSQRNLLGLKFKEIGIYKTCPLQHYLLAIDEEEGKEINLVWRTCSIRKQKPDNIITKSDREEQKHMNEYWYEVRITIPYYHGFRRLESHDIMYFKTLKELKQAINTKFTEYGFSKHYKVNDTHRGDEVK